MTTRVLITGDIGKIGAKAEAALAGRPRMVHLHHEKGPLVSAGVSGGSRCRSRSAILVDIKYGFVPEVSNRSDAADVDREDQA